MVPGGASADGPKPIRSAGHVLVELDDGVVQVVVLLCEVDE